MDKKLADKLVDNTPKLLAWETDKKITWCSNCGNYGIQNAMMRALVLEGYEREDFVMVFDVGCNGNGADMMDAYTMHGLHGRAIPLAAGAALANDKIKVIASGGDGASISEGVNHLVHGVRNNFPMVFICHNNENYGLTTGQASALTRCGVKMNGTPDGVNVPPVNICDFVMSLSPSFVARAYSGEVDHMTEIFRAALKHDGFAFIEVFQACPTYNRATPDDWYQNRVKFVEDKKGYDRHDLWKARKLIQDLDKDIYVGLIYEDPSRKSFAKLQKSREGAKTALVEEVGYVDIKGLV
jgi:2-oxoglutarate/2-oxoacid ferredoxin oxidoreductase subunit beta